MSLFHATNNGKRSSVHLKLFDQKLKVFDKTILVDVYLCLCTSWSLYYENS